MFATQIHTLVGDRLLNIKPITATMISGNTETLQIDGKNGLYIISKIFSEKSGYYLFI